MPSTPLKQMYCLRKYVQYISSQAPADMDLDHEDHPLAMANWSQHSNHTFMNLCYNNKQTISPQIQAKNNKYPIGWLQESHQERSDILPYIEG